MQKIIGRIIVTVLLILAACSGEKSSRLTIAIGGAPNEIQFWEQLVARFEDKTGIEVAVKRQVTDTDLRMQELFLALTSRQSDPDVFMMDVIWLPQFVRSGWLAPLDEYLTTSTIGEADFLTGVVNLADKYDGRLMALPVYVDGGLLYYRNDLLEKYGYDTPPETWAHLRDCAARVQAEERKNEPDFYGFVWQGAQYEGLVCTFLEFAASNGGGILDSTGVVVNSPANEEALTFMYDLIHSARISPPSTFTEMKEEEVRRFFQQGKALFERNWPYAWSLHQSDESPVAGKVGVAPLPRFDGGRSVSTLGGWHIGISAFSDAQSEAWKLIEYIMSFEIQKSLVLHLGWNPGRVDVYNDPEVLRTLPHLAVLQEVFEQALPRPTVPYYSRISEILQRNINAVLAGEMPAGAALAETRREIEGVITQYREE